MTPAERQKAWCVRNPEKARAIAKRSYEKRKQSGAQQEYKRGWVKKNAGKWKNYSEKRRQTQPYTFLLTKANARAKTTNRVFELDLAWARVRWTGRCEVTGIAFIAPGKRPGPYSPSLDRVDSRLGYTKDNCRFVLWAVNRFRGEDDDTTMTEIAEAIVAARMPQLKAA